MNSQLNDRLIPLRNRPTEAIEKGNNEASRKERLLAFAIIDR